MYKIVKYITYKQQNITVRWNANTHHYFYRDEPMFFHMSQSNIVAYWPQSNVANWPQQITLQYSKKTCSSRDFK